MEGGIQEFVAEEMWLLIGVVTFAVAGVVTITGFGTLGPVIAVIGWFLLTPFFLFWGEEIAAVLFDERKDPSADAADAEGTAIEELKRRYAAGEIDEAEFEQRLDRLVAVDDALDHVFTGEETDTVPASADDGDPGDRVPPSEKRAEEDTDAQDWELER